MRTKKKELQVIATPWLFFKMVNLETQIMETNPSFETFLIPLTELNYP